MDSAANSPEVLVVFFFSCWCGSCCCCGSGGSGGGGGGGGGGWIVLQIALSLFFFLSCFSCCYVFQLLTCLQHDLEWEGWVGVRESPVCSEKETL